VLGGAPLPEPTVIWWNYVVATVAEGRELEQEWRAGRVQSALPE
jgi:redox-sensitive bicupin YhaK (pirin superfamily)